MKKKKNVQLATEKEAVDAVKTVENVAPKPSQDVDSNPVLFNLADFPEEKVALAEEIGIPLKRIINRMNSWSTSVEARIEILARGINENPEKTLQLLQREALKAREEYARSQGQAGPQQAQPGGGLGEMLQYAKMLGISADTEDPFSKALKESMIKNAMESMNSDAQMGRSIKEHVVASLAQRVAKDITEKVIS